ncbi:MAG: rane protein, partial [Francisellaceae bacterium]|nr:rane protein [Francisellaceae bacterium]
LILIFVLIGIEAFLKVFISTGTSPKFLGLSLLILSGLFSQVINLLFYAILINVVLKWTNPNSIQTNLLTQTFSKITDPLIQPARRLIPPMGGIDVSPIIVMLGLQLLNIILVGPLSLEAHKFI